MPDFQKPNFDDSFEGQWDNYDLRNDFDNTMAVQDLEPENPELWNEAFANGIHCHTDFKNKAKGEAVISYAGMYFWVYWKNSAALAVIEIRPDEVPAYCGSLSS